MRVAAIDIGTNTVLLLVAERGPDGEVRARIERATITRLGEGVDRTRRMLPAAIARTRACLRDYALQLTAEGVERVAVVGTSAMRDAEGGHELRADIRSIFGVDARVLTGDEEARLTFSGAIQGLSAASHGEVGVFDIGGGSTEVVIGTGDSAGHRIGYAASFDIGSVRMTERYLTADPVDATELDALWRSAARMFEGIPPYASALPPIGVAGTVTTLAAIAMGIAEYDASRIHGHTVRYDELRALVLQLASMPVATRRAVPGMEPKRADVIVAGGVIALALLERWRASEMLVSDRGVRWGIATELMNRRDDVPHER